MTTEAAWPGRRAILHCDLAVSAASYEARVFGVRSAMPLQTAARLCPDGIFVPGDHEEYGRASEAVMALFEDHTPLVQPISLDEAFLDVTGTAHLFGGPVAVARSLKDQVRSRLGLVLSVGVATNKLCAKIGSDLEKPDGLVIVEPGREAEFLAPLPLQRLWGIGPKTREVLESFGLRTIGDLARADPTLVERHLGEHGARVLERARGIDQGEVIPHEEAKSVGHEHTFDRDTLDRAQVERQLLVLAEGVGKRLRAASLRGRTVTLKLRVAPFETRTRQRTLAEPTDDDLTIYNTGRALLREALRQDHDGGHVSPVRLVGVSVSGVTAGAQLGLFDSARTSRLNSALDAVRERFGEKALDRASARSGERRRFSDRPPRT